ncbi:MAG: prolipoprotein diacylglyceryl transferase [Coprobacillus sp.]
MYNDLFSIGGIEIKGYGLMIGIGMFASLYLAEQRAKKRNMNSDIIFSIFFTVVIFGFISAKLLYYITIFDKIMVNPSLLFDIGSGYVVYGGIIGGTLAGYIYCRKLKVDFLQYADIAMPSVFLAQGFGRIGCFLAGCCYGAETSSFFSITFHNSSLAPNNVALIPTQIYSSLFDFAACALLIYLASKQLRKGQVTCLYLIIYSIGRFIIEFFRGDLERGAVGSLSTSQFISIFVLISGVIMYIYLKKKDSQTHKS